MPENADLRARRTIANALKCSVDTIAVDATVDTLPQWDSIGHVNIVLEIETALGRSLLPEEIAGISSVADIALLFDCQTASA